MSNEPNAYELHAALAVREFLAAHHHPTNLISNCTEEIAKILAAHRAADESELAKAHSELINADLEIAALESKVQYLVSALDKYGEHARLCEWHKSSHLTCNCGLSAALAALAAAKR